jgi:hypothetical protein
MGRAWLRPGLAGVKYAKGTLLAMTMRMYYKIERLYNTSIIRQVLLIKQRIPWQSFLNI